ncbi:MAG: VWA domain-containing protein [bacterium]|nr:VWA domain-containing protein [bacterium]
MLGFASVASLAQQAEPIDSKLEEEVEVRLVLVDTLVLDRRDRPVADLTRDDFELFVDYDAREIDTFDVDCPEGPTDDPRSVKRPGNAWATPAPDASRKVVLAIDYMHVLNVDRAQVLEHLRTALGAATPSSDEIMLAAITGDLRVEQPFTDDRDVVLETLRRMEYDITLWLPQFDHEHELRFFRSLYELVDLLGYLPGHKAVVLYSNLPGPSASYDLAFAELAARCTNARVSFYPVLAHGMSLFTSPRLARMAVETGGRFTENTNDLTLGYARAKRDLTCRYVIGFYDRDTKPEKDRRISIRVRRPGTRTVHSYNFQFPSEEEQRRSTLDAAYLSPETFSSVLVRGHMFPLRPVGRKQWEALVAVGFAVDAEEWVADEIVRDVGISITGGRAVKRKIDRRVRLERPQGEAPATSEFVVVAPVKLRAGEYDLAVAVSDPAAATPRAAAAATVLPRLERDAPIVVGPFLGRAQRRELEIDVEDAPPPGDPSRRASLRAVEQFEPLLVQSATGREPLMALSRLCGVGEPGQADAERRLLRADGTVVATFGDVPGEVAEEGGVSCRTWLDRFPDDGLAPGDYEFELTVSGAAIASKRESVRFAVLPPAE